MSGDSLLYMDPVEFGKSVGDLIRELFDPMKKRLNAIETNNPIDIEIINELAGCLERVEALESRSGKRVKSLDETSQGGDQTGDVDPDIANAVARYLDAHPVPAPRGVQGALIDHEGALVLTMTDGTMQKVGRVVGRDGSSVDARDLEYLPATHEIIERWTAAGKMKEIRYPAGGLHDGGFWREGMEVKASRFVTHGGNLWISLRTTKAKPCVENRDDWRLAVRRGRDAVIAKDKVAGND